jgi:hypothetical protein
MFRQIGYMYFNADAVGRSKIAAKQRRQKSPTQKFRTYLYFVRITALYRYSYSYRGLIGLSLHNYIGIAIVEISMNRVELHVLITTISSLLLRHRKRHALLVYRVNLLRKFRISRPFELLREINPIRYSWFSMSR